MGIYYFHSFLLFLSSKLKLKKSIKGQILSLLSACISQARWPRRPYVPVIVAAWSIDVEKTGDFQWVFWLIILASQLLHFYDRVQIIIVLLNRPVWYLNVDQGCSVCWSKTSNMINIFDLCALSTSRPGSRTRFYSYYFNIRDQILYILNMWCYEWNKFDSCHFFQI